jgi:zinc transporter 1/2/3
MFVGVAFLALFLLQEGVKLVFSANEQEKDSSPVSTHESEHVHEEPGCCDNLEALQGMSTVGAVSMFVAMSFHAVLEGMILGAERSEDSGRLWQYAVAIYAHKVFEAFAVGSSLIQTKMSRVRFLAFSAVFVLTTPVGAVLGLLLSSDGSHSTVGGVINALAAGTFIQVATMEMLPKAFAKKDYALIKMVAVVLGFAGICFFAWRFPHTH